MNTRTAPTIDREFLLLQLRDNERNRQLNKLSGLAKIVQAARYKADDDKVIGQKQRLDHIQKGAQRRIERRREQAAAQERRTEINALQGLIGQLRHETATARQVISGVGSQVSYMINVAHQQQYRASTVVATQ